MVGTIANAALCTETTAIAGGCLTVGSCCLGFADVTGGTPQIGVLLMCFPAGNAVSTSMTVTSGLGGAAATTVYPITACAAAGSGASTLAVSAAALATAVYMM